MNSLIQFSGLYLRETLRFLKVPYQTIGTSIIMSSLYFLIFGISIGRSIDLENTVSYLAFLIPGMIALSVIRNAFENATSSIISAKYVNELQDLRVTPLTSSHIVLALSFASFTRGLIVAVCTYVVGTLFYYGQYEILLPIKHPFLLSYFLFFGGVSFGMLGLAIAMHATSFERVNSFSSFILVPLIYLGGVFFNLATLDPFWRFISKINPLFYIINGIRYSFIGSSDVNITFATILLFAFFIIFYVIALLSLRKGARYQRY